MTTNIPNIPKEKFAFVPRSEKIHDEKLQTKAVGYLGDAWNRFRTNKSAVVAFVLIMILLVFALVVPEISSFSVAFRDGYYKPFSGSGFWDGGKTSSRARRAIST